MVPSFLAPSELPSLRHASAGVPVTAADPAAVAAALHTVAADSMPAGWDPHVRHAFVTEAGNAEFEPFVAALSATQAAMQTALLSPMGPRDMVPEEEPLLSAYCQVVNALIGVPSELFVTPDSASLLMEVRPGARLYGLLNVCGGFVFIWVIQKFVLIASHHHQPCCCRCCLDCFSVPM